MSYTFIQEAIETYVLFGMSPVYVLVLNLVQIPYLKSLKQQQRKPDAKKHQNRKNQLKKAGTWNLFEALVLHGLIYTTLTENIRPGYYFSLVLIYGVLQLIMHINLYLRGASILKNTGPFGGLPG